MRSFELSNDEILRPNNYTIVRLDGRNFHTLVRSDLKLEPFDMDLTFAMRITTRNIMRKSGWNVIYGYTQSDEISLLLDPTITKSVFGGKVRKINSLLAAHTSVIFYKEIAKRFGRPDLTPTFDCRVIQIPNFELVKDYFVWRRNDSETNCLNAWAYFFLTKHDGFSPKEAQQILDGRWNEFKQDILFNHDSNYNHIPDWQKRGIGQYWIWRNEDAISGKTGESVTTLKRTIREDIKLPQNPNDYINLIDDVFTEFMRRKS